MAHEKYVTEFTDKDSVIYGVMDEEAREELAEQGSEIDRKAPAILRDASGDIVTISDGADGIPLSECVVQIDPVQAEGTPTPSDPLPITGRTGARITRADKCVFNPHAEDAIVQGSIKTADGSTSASNYRVRTGNYLRIEHGKTYTVSTNAAYIYIYEYADASTGSYIGTTAADWSAPPLTYTPSATANYIKICFAAATNNSIRIEPSYVQYCDILDTSGQVYPVSWQTAAGTVYGGSLTVHQDGTGTLIRDRYLFALNTYDGIWDILQNTSDSKRYYRTRDVVAFGEEDFAVRCNVFAGAEVSSSTTAKNTVCVQNTGLLAFRPQNNTASTSNGVKSLLAGIAQDIGTDVYAAIKLPEPQSYELTAAEVGQIIIQSGEQNIWADTGAVAVTYPADTRTYVDSAITAATDPDGNVLTVTGSTPSITGESGKRYVCGTVDSISITPPSVGIVDIVFSSGTTPAVLTVPNTVLFPGWFNPASLSASTKYEINVMDGTDGAVMAWSI